MTGLEVYLIVAPLVLTALAILATWWFVGRQNGLLRPRAETRHQSKKAIKPNKKLELRRAHYGASFSTSSGAVNSPILTQGFVVRGADFQAVRPPHGTSEARH